MSEPATTTVSVTWTDPRLSSDKMGRMSGMAFFDAMQRGEIPPPPIFQLMDMGGISVEEGRVVFYLSPGERHLNPMGGVHGGVPATILDSAMGCAVHTTLPAGRAYLTLELKINFLRPIKLGTKLLAIGTVLHGGRQTALAEARLEDEAGKLHAHATSTCLLFDLP